MTRSPTSPPARPAHRGDPPARGVGAPLRPPGWNANRRSTATASSARCSCR